MSKPRSEGDFAYGTESKALPYMVRPKDLINVYKDADPNGKIIGCMSELESGAVQEVRDGLGFVVNKKGWVDLSKVNMI